ncbi:MAG: hypothetical protein JNM27_18345 [Leptospirales bacterium]|nr:hypothetical protein [Leptospirales bacterium]
MNPIRLNLIADIRPGMTPFDAQNRFRYLGLTKDGLALLSFGGHVLRARIEGAVSRLPRPGDWIHANVEKQGNTIRLSQLTQPEAPHRDHTPEVPREVLGPLAELLHPGDHGDTVYPFSDFFLVPGVMRDKEKRAKLKHGQGKTRTQPYFFTLRTEWPTLGEIGLLFYANNPEFREAHVIITTRSQAVRERIEPELQELPVLGQVLVSGEAILDRSV